jgi:hypothetical protein
MPLTRKQLALLLLIAFAALLVHGYHPYVEDGAIYLPGIKKDLHPALYPFGAEFFMSHAHMTLFDEMVAASIRITHVPFDWAILLWHLGCVFALLYACWRIGRQCFAGSHAAWGGVAFLASLLTIPVAGTALLIMDQYLTTRDVSTAAIMLVIANALEQRWARAAAWMAFTAAIHPLMAVFGAVFLGLVRLEGRRPAWLGTGSRAANAGALLLPLGLSFSPPSEAYREALNSRSYFFLLRWEWYEWLGIVAPLALLWTLARYARRSGLRTLEAVSHALVRFGGLFCLAALVITVPPQLAGLTLLQPLRALHLIFIMLFVLLGGVLAETVLKDHAWRWAALLLPLCLGMFLAGRAEFPASRHLELPFRPARNAWVQAFEWVRDHTPQNAIFALNPNHMALPGEDQHGFRAIAERSMLADNVKDSGAVTMFPALAEEWREQVRAQQGWDKFQAGDFRRLRQRYGVTWVVAEVPVAGLDCPYRNGSVVVCRIP